MELTKNEIYDNNNQLIECKLLFTFQKENKHFIIYKDNEDDILASYYKIENDKIIITPIEDEKDYDLVDIEIEKWWNKNE